MEGDAVIVEVVSPPGDHKKVPPVGDGNASTVPVPPLQMASSITATSGVGVTVIVSIDGVLVQPFKVYSTE